MTRFSIDQAMRIAFAHHQAGRLAEAEALYRQVLAQQPQHPDALNLLGVIAHHFGHNDKAVELLRQAIHYRPKFAEGYCNLGNVLWSLKRFEESAVACRHAIELMPELGQAHINLGNALTSRGQFEEAVAAYRRAIQIRPDHAEAYYNLAFCLSKAGRTNEAIEAYRKAIQLRPDYVEAMNNLATELRSKGRFDDAVAVLRQALVLAPNLVAGHLNLGAALEEQEKTDEAIDAFRQAINLNPSDAEAHWHLGRALNRRGDFEEAATACRKAIQLNPNCAHAFYNLGNALGSLRRLDDSIASYREAIRLKPDYIAAWTDLGSALKDQCEPSQAIVAFRKALALGPDVPEIHWNLAISLLLSGDLQRGWQEFEWRWKCKSVSALDPRFLRPRWNGEELTGKTILLHAEQGVGDTIQFVRYVSEVAARGGRVILRCPRTLFRLLQNLPDVTKVLTTDHFLPAFDLHCPLLSLPLACNTTLDSIPRRTPYLKTDPKLAEAWADSMRDASGLKVGLAWAGNADHSNDKLRSMRLQQLSPLASAGNAQFFSLQKGPAACELADQNTALKMVDPSKRLTDFAETAALIANLDLVITVDTAVAHLAGALNKPVWVLLPFSPDWRWLLNREDSPWYPSMRLFRQTSPGNWDDVILRVTKALSDEMA